MIKRCLCLLLGCVMAGMASAQVPLQQKVARAVQEAPAKAAANAERRLIDAYHDGLVTVVDDILMQNPGLVDTYIIGEDGQRISMVYDAFLRPRRVPSKEQKALQEKVKQAEDRLDKVWAKWRRIEKRWDFYYDMTSDPAHPLRAVVFYAPQVIAEVRSELVRDGRRMNKRYGEWEKLQEQLSRQMEKDINRNNPMLEVFYIHGAECAECLNDSLKKGKLTPSEELSLLYQLPVYGAPADKIMQLADWTKWIKIANGIEVTAENLRTFLIKSVEGKEDFEMRLSLVYSQDPETQKIIESYRVAYKRAYEQEIKVRPQAQAPHAEVMFLGKKYKPKKAEQVPALIDIVTAAYEHEVKTKYTAYGNAAPAGLATQRDRAIAQLKQTQSQLEKYEATVTANQNEEYTSKARVFEGIRMLGARVDLLPTLLKTFPQAWFGQWKYYAAGNTVKGVPFQIPVIMDKHGNVYDARPETFGKQLL